VIQVVPMAVVQPLLIAKPTLRPETKSNSDLTLGHKRRNKWIN